MSNITHIADLLALAAGFLQLVGYIVYIRSSLHRELKPNPTTWFMFAYGTALLTLLEATAGAPVTLLILPVVCSVLSVFVAGLCWYRGTLRWPENATDRIAFAADIFLTAVYIAVWILSSEKMIGENERVFAAIALLMISNATTFTAFYPLVRNSYHHPNDERSLPWLIWSAAYSCLGVATLMQSGPTEVLLLYPLINAAIHGLVAWFASKREAEDSR